MLHQFAVYLTLTTSYPGAWPTTVTARSVQPAQHRTQASAQMLAERLVQLDPFQASWDDRLRDMCGGNRELRTVRPTVAQMLADSVIDDPPWYAINDEVILDAWELRDGESWWTPYCAGSANLR